MSVQLVSKSAYARHRGCDEKAVRKAVLEGRISLIDGKIDPAVADVQWERNTRARVNQKTLASSPPSSEAQAPRLVDPTYQQFRARREEAEAQIAEMNAAKMRGGMVLRDDVDRGVFDVSRQLRDRLATCGRRISSELVGLKTAEEFEQVIAREIHIALAELTLAFREALGSAPKAAR